MFKMVQQYYQCQSRSVENFVTMNVVAKFGGVVVAAANTESYSL